MKIPKAGATEKEVTMQVLDAARLYGLSLERRNVGLAFGASGRAVRFGEAGDCDWTTVAVAGPNRGRRIDLELKHEGFDPSKLRGKKAEHFAKQRKTMERINADGGLALWVDSAAAFVRFYQRVLDWPGIRVEFDAAGFPEMTNEPEGNL